VANEHRHGPENRLRSARLPATLRPLRTTLTALLLAASLTAAAPGDGAEAAPSSFTVAVSGDVIIHEAIAAAARTPQGYDFRPLFSPVEPWVSDADLALCHLEVPLSPDNTGLSFQDGEEHPALFTAPREVAEGLAAAGWDGCSTAGNHAMDAGIAGITGTLDVLDAAGLGHAGTARTGDDRAVAFYPIDDVLVAHLAYTIPTNVPPPWEQRWAVNVIEPEAILADASWARGKGADFVILSLHWGEEYETGVSGWQRSLARDLLASADVDLIVGSHSHVVAPVEWIDGEVVVYGVGNHLSNIRGLPDDVKTGSEDGAIVQLTVSRHDDGRLAVSDVAYTATWVDPVSKQVLPVAHTLAQGAGGLAATLEWSLERTAARITAIDGSLRHTPEPWPSLTCRGRVATLWGSGGPDLLIGTPGDDVIVGRGGNDTIWGMGGRDLVCGGDGNDVVAGDGGDDFLDGGPGDDLVEGGIGADAVYGGDGDDFLDGGHGDDLVVSGGGADHLSGGPGDDSVWAWNDPANISGGSGSDDCRAAGSPIACD
jgi:poly-gamma-glutamate synthesis protein (capsule biosynthesis protein)